MNVNLMDFQKVYVNDMLGKLRLAKRHAREGEQEGVLLSAPTGSGKTVMMTAVLERILEGDDGFQAEPNATFLWLSDQPDLNEQSRHRILTASGFLREHQLVVVGPEFDKERFEGGKVYFLNTQKLGKDKNLTVRGDKRSWTIWETIQNSVGHLRDRFYVIIDEAHRGMNTAAQEAENKTILQKFLLGSPGELDEAVPLVIGITATPERFVRLVGDSERHLYKVVVDVNEVRASGLLKDRLVVRLPQTQQPNDWSLLAAAVRRWATVRDDWGEYCLRQKLEPVYPILVIQVEDGSLERVSATDLATALRTIEETVGSLQDEDIAHCFQEAQDLRIGQHRVRRLDPSKVNDDPAVKFVFFKMALSTGWDCPRAEVMMSFRRAQDSTYIAQLIGRMVRTPLARRIEGSETLNEVHLYLPYYDRKRVASVVERLKGDPDNVPATEVVVASELLEIQVPHHLLLAHAAIDKLPTYEFSQGKKAPDIRRLIKLVYQLSVHDGIDPAALGEAKTAITDLLLRNRKALLGVDEQFRNAVKGTSRIEVQPLVVDQITFEVTEGNVETVVVSRQNVEDLFKLSKQRLGEGFCLEYLRRSDLEQLQTAKLELFLMLQNPDILKSIDRLATSLIREFQRRNHAAIKALESGQRLVYQEIAAGARIPEASILELPRKISVPVGAQGDPLPKHLFCDSAGEFRSELLSWEHIVLAKELDGCVAWLRNFPRKPWAIRYKYELNGKWMPGYPDFIIVRHGHDGLRVDLLEPHSGAFSDAWAKAKGMATFARDHSIDFGRIEMERVEQGKVIRLDFNVVEVRNRALALNNNSELDNLFSDLGTIDS